MRVARSKRKYEPAFREQAVALLERTERSFAEVARSLGVPAVTLGNWYRQEMARRRAKPKVAAMTPTPGAVPPETLQQKLQRLERENTELRRKVEDLQLDRTRILVDSPWHPCFATNRMFEYATARRSRCPTEES